MRGEEKQNSLMVNCTSFIVTGCSALNIAHVVACYHMQLDALILVVPSLLCFEEGSNVTPLG